MTNRERAVEFVFSLPQYKGVLRDREGYMARRKECRQLVDRLEKQFDEVNPQHVGIRALSVSEEFAGVRGHSFYNIPPTTSELYAKQIEAERREAGIT